MTANQLRVARGDVRCGNCAHVFNAMESLADELPGNGPEAATGAPESPAPEQYAELGDEALEFDAPEQTWSEIFISAPPKSGDVALDGELEAITANPDEWRAMLAEIGVEPGELVPDAEDDMGFAVAAASLAEEHEAEAATTGTLPASEFLIGPDQAAAEPRAGIEDLAAQRESWLSAGSPAKPTDLAAVAALPLADTIPADVQAADEGQPADLADDLDDGEPPWRELEADELAPPRRAGLFTWIAAVFLATTLAAQLAYHYRDTLATHPRYGELVRETCDRLGLKLYPAWPLSAFHIRRSEAMVGGSEANALDINAAVEVSGGQPVGLPLVRVTLRDQWSNTVGSRVFVPDEYLAGELPGIVAPGTRIPVALSLADPGPQARGYEVDLCLQRRWTGLECQLAQPAARP